MEYYDYFRKDFEPEAFKLADFAENYDNSKKKLDWGDVNNEGLDYLGIKGIEKRNKILSQAVRELTYRGYSIESNPFRLEKY